MEGAKHKHPPYMAIFIALTVLTVGELYVAFLPFSKMALIIILIFLAVWKALMVALYFMHLRFEKNPVRILAAAPLPLTVIIVLAVITEFRW